jgi:hypothetical protein
MPGTTHTTAPHDCPYDSAIKKLEQDANAAQIDETMHDKHHIWIQEKIKCERDKRRMYREITKLVIQWSIPAISGTIYYWVRNHWN